MSDAGHVQEHMREGEAAAEGLWDPEKANIRKGGQVLPPVPGGVEGPKGPVLPVLRDHAADEVARVEEGGGHEKEGDRVTGERRPSMTVKEARTALRSWNAMLRGMVRRVEDRGHPVTRCFSCHDHILEADAHEWRHLSNDGFHLEDICEGCCDELAGGHCDPFYGPCKRCGRDNGP